MSASNSQVRKESLQKDLDRVTPLLSDDRCHSRYKEAFDDNFTQPFSKVQSLLPADEFETRGLYGISIELKIWRAYPHYKLDQRHRAVILSVPMSSLSPGGNLSAETNDANALIKALTDTYGMLCRIMQVSIPGDVPQTVTQQQLQAADDAEKARDGNEKELCLARDMKRCVVTGAADPEVCHIVPWSLNKSLRNIMSTRQFSTGISSMLGARYGAYYEGILAPSTQTSMQAEDPRGQSDKSWNMICLNPQLHAWWGKAYFAFKPSITKKSGEKAIVDLQFHWMPKIITNATSDYTSIANQLKESMKSDPTLSIKPHACHGSPIVQAFLQSGERLATGHVFSVEMNITEALHFYNMMNLQWISIQIIALAGGAGCPDLSSSNDDDSMPFDFDVRNSDSEDESVANDLEPGNESMLTYHDPDLADSSVLTNDTAGELTNMMDTLSLS